MSDVFYVIFRFHVVSVKNIQTLTVAGWPNLKEKANGTSIMVLGNVYAKVSNMDNPFGQRHIKCRIDFSSKLGKLFK